MIDDFQIRYLGHRVTCSFDAPNRMWSATISCFPAQKVTSRNLDTAIIDVAAAWMRPKWVFWPPMTRVLWMNPVETRVMVVGRVNLSFDGPSLTPRVHHVLIPSDKLPENVKPHEEVVLYAAEMDHLKPENPVLRPSVIYPGASS